MKLDDYAIRIEPLLRGEGGFLVTIPDLPGCVVDGETVDAAIAEAHDAFKVWAGAEQLEPVGSDLSRPRVGRRQRG